MSVQRQCSAYESTIVIKLEHAFDHTSKKFAPINSQSNLLKSNQGRRSKHRSNWVKSGVKQIPIIDQITSNKSFR